MMPFSPRSTLLPAAILALTIGGVRIFADASSTSIDVKRGEPAPRIHLETADGALFDTATLRDEAWVVLFAETGQEKSRLAHLALNRMLNEPVLLGEPIRWLIVLSKSSDPGAPGFDIEQDRLAPVVLHDADRVAFGVYGVVVVPSVVVVDRQGRVVHVMSGLMPRFEDITLDALRVATGELSVEEFDLALDGHARAAQSPEQVRATRLLHLAQRLAQRGMPELAATKYREVIELQPDMIAARLGYGEILIAQGSFAEAEATLLAARRLAPDSLEVMLGLADVYVHGEESHLPQAELLVNEVLKATPDEARAFYLRGILEERRGEMELAAKAYRTAAELLLEQLKTPLRLDRVQGPS